MEKDEVISRRAAIAAMCDACWDWCDEGVCKRVSAIQKLPSAQPERKKGKWTDDNTCPFCGFHPWYERDIHTLSYCPKCGADMRERKSI